MAAALQYGKTNGSDALIKFWGDMMGELIEPYPTNG